MPEYRVDTKHGPTSHRGSRMTLGPNSELVIESPVEADRAVAFYAPGEWERSVDEEFLSE